MIILDNVGIVLDMAVIFDKVLIAPNTQKYHQTIKQIILTTLNHFALQNASVARQLTDQGDHGYDNALLSMKPIFYAMGPNIRRNYQVPVFRNVDIYPLICELLQIRPAANNGSLLRVQNFVVSSDSINSSTELTTLSAWVLFLFSILVCGVSRT